jgi:hypothetical protein
MFLAERAEGLSAVATGWAFAAAAEAALGVEPPPEAARTRAVALELERLYNHAAAMAALCQATGLTVGQSAAEIAWNGCCGSTRPSSATGTCSASSSPAPGAPRTPTRYAGTCPAPTTSCAAPPTRCCPPTRSWTGWRPPAS